MDKVFLLGLLGYLGFALKNIPRILFNLFKTNITSSISINNKNNEQYKRLNNYLFNLNKKCFHNNIESSDEWSYGQNFKVLSINYGTYLFKIKKGAYCFLRKEMKDQTDIIYSIITLTIFGKNRIKVLNEIKESLNFVDINSIKSYSTTDIYDNGKLISKRYLNQIFFKQKEELISKIDKWLDSENNYTSRGVIYKLGILLHGEPGCGKSSLAKIIASYCNFNLFYINLKGFRSYEQLIVKLTNIPEKSVVLFEDIDCIIGNRENKENLINSEEKEILNVALNFLDGVISPNNCIIIATTNYVDRLDSAFTRSGRFDINIKLEKLDYDLAKQMCESFNVDIDELNINTPINPSELQNKLIEYL